MPLPLYGGNTSTYPLTCSADNNNCHSLPLLLLLPLLADVSIYFVAVLLCQPTPTTSPPPLPSGHVSLWLLVCAYGLTFNDECIQTNLFEGFASRAACIGDEGTVVVHEGAAAQIWSTTSCIGPC